MFNLHKYILATKFNLYGHPIRTTPTRFFADEDVLDDEKDIVEEMPNVEEEEEIEEPVITPDPPAGVQNEIVPPKQDPTANWPASWLPPTVHDNCRCVIRTMPGGRKIWEKSDTCCEVCANKARIFNIIQNKLYGV